MEVMVGEDRLSGDLPARRDPVVQNDGERRLNKGVKADDAVSTITGDHLTVLRKRFHFPNDLVVTVPKRSDRACLPPPGYLAIYEANLRVGLQFPPPPELIEILVACGLSRRMDLEIEFTQSLDEWNKEFVKVKYLQGEYKRKYDRNVKEMKVMEEELCECRTELANIVHSVSLQNQQIDRLQIDLVEAQAEVTQLLKDQKASMEKISALEAENKRSQTLIAEKEAALSGLEAPRVIEDFKRSIAFKTIIQNHVQEARNHIYDIERKTGVAVEGLTPSQASGSSPTDSDGDEIESELQKAFALEVDDEIIDVE
ncbi:hypothetical protein M5K25_008705 [Dendrobium thyrsiflorum]|uniref:Uncharacterized protein n=1 Tax=Dendrobium thyrsiflorum TaxID=117978 RepID=A0ABD0VA90_DENTH